MLALICRSLPPARSAWILQPGHAKVSVVRAYEPGALIELAGEEYVLKNARTNLL